MSTIKFNSPKEMYNLIKNGTDLYSPSTCNYIFVYNDSDSLCVYSIEPEEAKTLAEKSKGDNNEYWGAFLGLGGEIHDSLDYKQENPDYFSKKDREIDSALELCKELYQITDFIDTKDYLKETIKINTNEIERD